MEVFSLGNRNKKNMISVHFGKSPTRHLNTLAASFHSVSSFDREIRLKSFKLAENQISKRNYQR